MPLKIEYHINIVCSVNTYGCVDVVAIQDYITNEKNGDILPQDKYPEALLVALQAFKEHGEDIRLDVNNL